MSTISRQQYADLFGPTTGDKIRLGDTSLFVSIEKDLRTYGDEAVYGGGKTLRDGMGMDNELTSIGGAPDLLITNVTIIDAVLASSRPMSASRTARSSRSAGPATPTSATASTRSCRSALPPRSSAARARS